MSELRTQFTVQYNKQNELLNGYEPGILEDRLKIAASQADEEAEALIEQFSEGTQSNLVFTYCKT